MPIMMSNTPLPWVDTWSHLGNQLHYKKIWTLAFPLIAVLSMTCLANVVNSLEKSMIYGKSLVLLILTFMRPLFMVVACGTLIVQKQLSSIIAGILWFVLSSIYLETGIGISLRNLKIANIS